MKDPSGESLSETFRWALESSLDPSMAAADWLARDIDPERPTVMELLTDEGVALESLRQAKDAFKTMRVIGETTSDRRAGARLYAATIAAALVHHKARISRQSDAATRRALTSLLDDEELPEKLRTLAGTALAVLDEAG
ncbi:MAG: hypothetical protein ACYTGC_00930 [Planctomycetota bacterium]|jgi:hypothetical protein